MFYFVVIFLAITNDVYQNKTRFISNLCEYNSWYNNFFMFHFVAIFLTENISFLKYVCCFKTNFVVPGGALLSVLSLQLGNEKKKMEKKMALRWKSILSLSINEKVDWKMRIISTCTKKNVYRFYWDIPEKTFKHECHLLYIKNVLFHCRNVYIVNIVLMWKYNLILNINCFC